MKISNISNISIVTDTVNVSSLTSGEFRSITKTFPNQFKTQPAIILQPASQGVFITVELDALSTSGFTFGVQSNYSSTLNPTVRWWAIGELA